MSILIKGMELPQGCYNCPLQHRGFNGSETVHYCYVAAKEVSDDGEMDTDCPLIEVPTPHGRSIDADAFYELLDGGYDLDFDGVPETKWELLRMITDAPTVIEAEGE